MIRRHGALSLKCKSAWNSDFNEELLVPMIETLMHSWTSVFATNLFCDYKISWKNAVRGVLQEVIDSVPGDLSNLVNGKVDRALKISQ